MKRLHRPLSLFIAAATALSISSTAVAATYQWDQNTGSTTGLGGTGAWDTSSLFWDLVGTGTDLGLDTTVAYTFTNTDTAIFGGTAGTVTLGTGITLNNITFNTAGYTITGNTLTLAGTSPSITTNQNATISSLLAGAAGLVKRGAGTLTLNGSAVNTLTGGVTVGAGTLLLDYANLGTPTDLINSGNALTLAGGTLAIKGNASGTTSQTFNGLTLNAGGSAISLNSNGGASTTLVLGGITRNAGATVNFTLPAAGSITTSATNDATGILGTWASVGSGAATTYATISGGAIAAYTGATTATDAAGLTDTTGLVNYNLSTATGTVPATVSANTIRYTGGAATTTLGATSFSVNGLMNAGTGLWTIGSNTLTIGANRELVVNTAAQDITISSIIANNGANASSLVKTGSGILTLSGVNTYTGGTVIAGGTLKISADTGLGAAPGAATPGNITLNGGTLQVTANGITINANRGLIIGSAGGTILTPNAGQTTTINGVITGSGPLTVSGSGQVTMSAANPNFSGDVKLTGNVRLGVGTSSTPLGTGTITVEGTSTYNSGSGAQFMAGVTTISNNFIISGCGGNSIDSTQRGALRLDGTTLNGTITLASNASIGAHAATGTVNGKITGGYTLHINGPAAGSSGTILLTNSANDYTGGTSINLGTLGFSNGALGTTGTITMRAGSGLMWNTGNTQDISSRLSLVGDSTFNTNGNDVTFATALSGGVAVTKTGAGTLKLSGANTYSGNTTISGGTLDLSGTSGIYNGATKGNANSLVINSGGVLVGDRWSWADGQSLGRLNFNSGYIAVDNGTIRNTAAGSISFENRGIAVGAGGITYENATAATTWTIDGGANANSYAANAAVRLAGAGNGILAQTVTGTGVNIVKSGAGTWNLTAANNYTGTTVVNAGTLSISGASGAATGSGAITIAGGATLTIDNSTASVADRLGTGAISLIGTLNYFHNGAASTSFSETLGSVTSTGGTILTSQAASGQTSVLTLGGLSGLANFTGTGLGVDDRNKIIITGATAGALIGTYGTGGLATYNATNGVVEATYTDVPFAGTIADGASTNIRLTGGTSGNVALGSTVTTVNALVQNQTSATTIDAASKTLRLSANGIVALGLGKGALTIGTAASSGTLTAGGADNTAGTISLLNHDATAALTVNSVIANNGTGAVTLVAGGAGKVVLAGANTFTGGITIGSGTLELGGAGTLGASGSYAGNIANGGILKINTSANQTLTGVISGTGSLVKDGTGTLTLNTAQNTYTGGTIVNGGTLNLARAGGGSTLLVGSVTINSGATVNATAANVFGWTNGFTGLNINGGTFNAGSNAIHFYDNNSGVISINMTGGTLTIGSDSSMIRNAPITVVASGNQAVINGAGTLNIRDGLTQTFNIGNGAQDVDLLVSLKFGESSGTGSVIKTGTGTMAFTGANTYAGTTTISSGALRVGNNTGLGTTANGTIVATGAALELYNGITVGAEALTLNGSGISNGGALRNISGNNTFGGAITMVSSSRINSDTGTLTLSGGIAGLSEPLTFGGASNTVVSGIIGSAGLSIVKDGTGTLTLSGANTYTGTTTVSAGRLSLTGSAGASAVSVASGATLGGEGTTAGALNFNGGALLAIDPISAGVLTTTGAVNFAGTTNLSLDAIPAAVGSQTVDVLKYGSLTNFANLSASSFHSATLADDTVNKKITLAFTTANRTWVRTTAGDWDAMVSTSWAEGDFKYGQGDAVTFGDTATNGSVNVVGSLRPLSVTVNNSTTNYTFSGSGSIIGTTGLTKSGTGTLTVTTSNPFTGAVAVNGGTLQIGDGTNTTASVGSGAITVGANTLKLNFNGAVTLANSSVTAATGLIQNIGTGKVTINNTNAGFGTIDGGTAGIVLNTAYTAGVGGTVKGDVTLNGGGSASINSNSGPATVHVTNNGQFWWIGATVSTGAMTLDISSGVTVSLNGGQGAGTIYYNDLTGAGGLTYNGNATGYILGNSTLGGTLTASNRDISFGNGGTTGTAGATTIVNNGGVTFNSTTDNTYSGTMSGTGWVKKNAANTLTITGANSYSGVTTLTGGTISVATLANGGANSAIGASTNAAANLVFDGGTLKYTGANVVSDRSFTINAGKTATIDTTNNLTLAGATGAAATGALTKTGAGTLSLSGQNTYTGTTTVSAGTLRLAGTVYNMISSTGAVIIESGATLTADNTTQNAHNLGVLTINGGTLTSVNGPGGTANDGDFGNWILRGVTVGGTTRSTISATTIQINTGGFNVADSVAGSGTDLLISSSITGSGSLTKSGVGTMELSGTNTYSGKTTVGAGTLAFSAGNASATASQQLGTNAAVDLGVAGTSSGTLRYTGAAGTLAKNINALGNGTDTVQNAGSGLLTLSGTLTKNGTVLTLKGGTSGIDVTGSIAGASANSDLVIDGGTTTLSATNTYNGPTYIRNGGTLNANVAGALPTATRSALILDDTGTGSSTLTLGASQVVASLTGETASKVNLGANTLTVGTTAGGTEFKGVIAGATGNLIKDGNSTLTLSGTNTYTGLTTVSAGSLVVGSAGSLASTSTLSIGASGTADFQNAGQTLGAVSNANTAVNALNFSATTGTVTLDSLTGGGNTRFGSNATITNGIASGTVTTVGALTADISGGTIGAGSLSSTSITGGTTTVGGTATIGTMSAGTMNLNGATSTITTLNGGTVNISAATVLTVNNGTTSGLITSGGRLAKATTGTVLLSGDNTYTGGTTISAGTLITANTSALGTGGVTVDSTATLQIGNGTTNAVTLGSGANLAVAGTLSLGGANSTVTMSGGASFDFTGGSVYIGSLFDSDVGRTSYQLISGATGTGTTNVTGFDHNVFSSVTLNANGALIFTAIPEPSTYGLLGAGALALTAAVRRRRRTK